MIPVLIAILLLISGIIISRKFILIKEWLIWACIVVDIYMKDGVEAAKLKVLKTVGRKRFPIMVCLISNRILAHKIELIEAEIKNMKNSMVLYEILIYGVNFYHRDYSIFLDLMDDEGKSEKA